jgi:hypothetical protein
MVPVGLRVADARLVLSFVDAGLHLLPVPLLARTLGERGYELVQTTHAWERLRPIVQTSPYWSLGTG